MARVDIAIGFLLAALLGHWVFADATARRASKPLLWGVGAFLLAIVVLPLWLLTRPRMEAAATTGPRRCPMCTYPVQPTATVCIHCGQDLPASG